MACFIYFHSQFTTTTEGRPPQQLREDRISLRRRDRVVRLCLIPGPRLPVVPCTADGWCFRGFSFQSKSVPCSTRSHPGPNAHS